MNEPRIIELDPSVWMRGKRGGYLLVDAPAQPRQQCCIGVACTALGVPDESIAGEGCVEELPLKVVPGEFQSIAVIGKRFRNEYDDYDDYDDVEEYISNDNLARVYDINDNPEIEDDATRVQMINAELEKVKASFRFALKEAQ
jgi:hypothetical protein